MRSTRRKVRSDGRGKVGEICHIALRYADEVHKPGQHHDKDAPDHPIAMGGPGAGTPETADRLES